MCGSGSGGKISIGDWRFILFGVSVTAGSLLPFWEGRVYCRMGVGGYDSWIVTDPDLGFRVTWYLLPTST